MKLLALVLILLSVSPLWAQDKRLGVGVMLGNPTGVNGKYWLNNGRDAIDGGFGISPGKESEVSVHSDYLFHNFGSYFFNDVHPLDLYYGLGARMEFEDDIQLGVRVPIGLAYKLEDKTGDIFVEAAPVFDFITNNGIEIHALFGGRYYY